MNDIVFRTDIFERVYGLLVGEIQDPELQPNWRSVIEIFTEQWQEIENVFKELNTERWLSLAVGRQLDLIGTIVGLERQNWDDEQYRTLLLFEIQINKSFGQPEIVLQAMLLFTGATRAILFEEFPAAMFGFVNAPIENIPPDMVQFLDRLSLGGVRFMYLTINDDANPFTYDENALEDIGYAGVDGSYKDAGSYSAVLKEDR